MVVNIILSVAALLGLISALQAFKFQRAYRSCLKERLSKTEAALLKAQKQCQSIKKLLKCEDFNYMTIERRNSISVVRFDKDHPSVHISVKEFPFTEGDNESREVAIFEAEELIEYLTS